MHLKLGTPCTVNVSTKGGAFYVKIDFYKVKIRFTFNNVYCDFLLHKRGITKAAQDSSSRSVRMLCNIM